MTLYRHHEKNYDQATRQSRTPLLLEILETSQICFMKSMYNLVDPHNKSELIVLSRCIITISAHPIFSA